MNSPHYGSSLDPLRNLGSQPLVTVVVVTHEGDHHLLPRALQSLEGQLPAGQLEVIVMNDGPSAPEFQTQLEAQVAGLGYSCEFIATPEHSGYYTVARNRSMEFARGLYVAHMDADNEFATNHLLGLLKALRIPDPQGGWPHFAYTRRTYVKDPGCEQTVPEGPSPFMEWNEENRKALINGPKWNFIDTADMMIPRSVLYMLAERTGFVWDANARRFGDYDLVCRMLGCGFRGWAVDQATNIYHWTGTNLQLTRGLSEVMFIHQEVYDKLKAEGKLM